MKRRLLGLVAAGVMVSVGQRPLAAQEPAPATLDSIHALATQAREALGAPGMSVAVAQGDEVVFLRGYGMADLENAVLAKPTTAYRSASLTKPLTATAVLQLVERGELALDASIRAYVPALPPSYDAVTLRDLLRHTSGVRHYREGEFITTRHCDRLADALQIFAADALDHAPGQKITYSSYAYTLLGLAIEAVTGASFSDYMRAHVFEPAGMRATRLDDLDVIPDRARGYDREEGGEFRNAPPLDTSCRIPAGGFVSTVEDLARFALALDAGALLDSASVREMMRSQVTPEIVERTLAGLEIPPGYEPPGLAFGWAVSPGEDGAVYHGGNQPGATAMLYHLPQQDVTVVIMTNLGGIGDDLTELAGRMADVVAAGVARRTSTLSRRPVTGLGDAASQTTS